MRFPAAPLLVGSAGAAVLFHWLRLWLAPSPPPDVRPLLPAAFPAASAFSERGGEPPRWTALGATTAGAKPPPLGAVVSSADIAPDVRGYAGAVPVLVGVGPDGTITGVALLPNHETPSYAARIEKEGFLRQFNGRRAGDPLLLGEDVDGVTRATVTAAAIASGVRRSARAAARESTSSAPAGGAAAGADPLARIGAVALAIALGLASLLAGSPALRWAAFAVSLGTLGLWQKTWLSAVNLANALLWRWPAWREHLPWYLLFGAAVATAAFWRNLYCARLCPFGALQELLHALLPWRLAARARGGPRRPRPARRVPLARDGDGLRLRGRGGGELRALHHRLRPAGGAAALGPARGRAAPGPVRHRPWCRYFCPTGTCLQLLGRMRTRNPFD